MIRVRVTFTVKYSSGSVTHEILVPELNDDVIRYTLNEDMFELRTSSNNPMEVDQILLINPLYKFSPQTT